MSSFLNKLFQHEKAFKHSDTYIPLQQVPRSQHGVAPEPEAEPEPKPEDGVADEEDDQPLLPGDTWDLASLKAEVEKELTSSKRAAAYERA